MSDILDLNKEEKEELRELVELQGKNYNRIREQKINELCLLLVS